MKKHLLTLALAVLATASAFAYGMDNALRTGNSYYTERAKWQLTGAPNAIAAGSQNLDGWLTTATTADGSVDLAAIADYFMVVDGVGPQGQSVIEVVTPGAENTAGDIFLATEIPAGNYIVAYKVKGAQARTMSNPNTLGTNSQRIFLNNDGTVNMDKDPDFGNAGVPVSKWLNYTDEWKEIAYQVTVSETMNVVFRFTNMQAGDQFTDFAIYSVKEVFDERAITDVLNKIKMFLADEQNFPNGRDDAEGLVEDVESMLAEADDLDASDADEYLSAANDGYQALLDANTVNIGGYFTNFDFGPEIDKNSAKTLVKGWTLNPSSDRWNRKAPAGDFKTSHINQEAGAKSVALGEDSYYQTIKMIPGARVMYTVLSSAHYDWKGTEWGGSEGNSYNTNYADTIANQRFFINNDTTVMEHLSPTIAKEYTMFGVIGADSLLTIGFRSGGSPANAGGGDFRFDNIDIRLIGGLTQEQVDEFFFKNAVLVQRDELEKRLATADEYMKNPKYIYAKDSLQRAIDLAEAAYALPNEWTEAFRDVLLAEVNRLKNAWQYVEKQNAEYTALADIIVKADAALADETRLKGKNELTAVKNAAKAAYDAVQAVVPYSAEDEGVVATKAGLVEQTNLLTDAVEDFYYLNASYNTPGDVAYTNPDVTSADGWTRTRTGNTSFGAQGYSYSRGNGANDAQRVYQDVTVKKPGVYVFTAIIAANNNGSRDSEETGVYLYMGNDSVQVHTTPIKEEWNPGNFAEFSVRHIVNNVDEENPVQIGLNGDYNKVCNQIRFGFTTLKYYGPYDEYVKDSIAAVMKPTKDSLQLVINQLTEMKNEARNPQNVNVAFMGQALETAQNVVNNSEDFDLIMSQFDLLESARQRFVLSGVYPATGKYYELGFLVKNPTFEANTEDATIIDWVNVIDAEQQFNSSNGVLYGKNYTGVEEVVGDFVYNRTKLTQQLSGLPAGAYQFGFNATFHGDTKNGIYQVVSKQELFVTTPTDTVAAGAIVQEGMTIEGANAEYGTDQNSTYLVYSDDVKLLLYDYRHGANTNIITTLKKAFDMGYYLTVADLNVAAGDQPVVGFYLQDMPTQDCNFFLANPTLRFYGDDANRETVKDGIQETVVAPQYAGAIYNLAGQKLSGKNLKGIYIQNGKKYVVK